jgi:hypothetical protein
MVSKKLLEIESSIRSLSLEEQQWLLKHLSKEIHQKSQLSDKFVDSVGLAAQIKAMAEDSEIQAEITAINREFAATEMDGLLRYDC